MYKQTAKFLGRLAAAAALVAIGTIRAQAKDHPRFEVAFETGYTASEGIQTSSARVIGGSVYNDLDVKSGGNFGFTAGFFITPNAEVEFLWNRQFSQFDASNPAPSLLLADVNVDNYFGNFVYNWFDGSSKIRPFAFGGLGATHYMPGDPVALPKVTSATSIDSATKFAWTFGGGVKVYPTQHVGIRLSARWTPTYIKSDSAGLWCDPYYPTCWVLADPDYSNQFAMTGGVTLKFDH
jgi:opacity protein-like surface antigen